MRFSLFLVLTALVFAAVSAAPVHDEAEQQNGEPLTEELQDPMNDVAEKQNGEPLTEELQDPRNDDTEEQNGEPLTEELQDPMNGKRSVGPKVAPQPGESLMKDIFEGLKNAKL